MDSRTVHSPARSISNDPRSPTSLSPKEPPSCVQNAMFNKEKKPFTYTPGGLDLSQIKSEKMAKRLMRNAMSPGVQEKPKPPLFSQNNDPSTPKSCHYFNLPVAVFPCVQIPPNPKQLLRRTSGPFSRSESLENGKETPKIIDENLIINHIIEESKQKKKDIEPNESPPEINNKQNIIDKEPLKVLEEEKQENLIPINNKVKENVESESKESEINIELNANQSNESNSNSSVVSLVKEYDEISVENREESPLPIEENSDVKICEDLPESPVVEYSIKSFPKIFSDVSVVESSDEKTVVFTLPLKKSSSDKKSDVDSDFVVKLNGNCESEPEIEIKNTESLKQNHVQEEKEEERVASPMRRGVETIKGLSKDLDKLPSLNINSKRFSFLMDEPVKKEETEDDPFRLITGIPPKISLIDNVPRKEPSPLSWIKEKSPVCIKENSPPIKIENISTVTDIIVGSKENEERKQSPEPIRKKIDSIIAEFDNFRSPSPFSNKNDYWKNSTSSLSRNDSLTLKDILKDDPEPAWKKEIREIALRKAEAKEECDDYKSTLKPTFPEFSVLKSNDKSYRSPWSTFNDTFYKNEEKPAQYLPTWSQTLRPKSWKERNSDSPSRPDTLTWMRPSPVKSFADKFVKENTPYSLNGDVRKTPEITVEVVNQPPSYNSTPVSNNGYVNPWESSPESSVAFSPEPRTPTPHSRNSPFMLSPQYPTHGYMQTTVIPREYGTLSYQPKRRLPNRSCPIQSRSFKYLQLLTGTDDSYEDDEPFIPQPPQHAYPRPGNF